MSGACVLAIETASADVAVAVADPSGVLASTGCRTRRGHAERLHLMVVTVLEMAGLTLGDIDCVAVDVGPGLFTGIRVGLAAAKGYGMGLRIPAVGVTSLEILADAASPGRDDAVAVVDLRRGEVAWRLTWPTEVALVTHGKPEALVAALRERHGEDRVVLAGDGALRYADLLAAELPNVVVASPALASAPVASLGMLGVRQLVAGKAGTPAGITPVYLRDADVRINWTTRHDSPRHEEPAAGGGSQ
jgi:tRNA threonylcarbamoyladenosine biosynthesis protein TsaB